MVRQGPGSLFILTFITSIAGVMAYGPVLTDPNDVTSAGADSRVFLGAFLELQLIITNIGCAVVLFPLLKRQNEGLAIGTTMPEEKAGTMPASLKRVRPAPRVALSAFWFVGANPPCPPRSQLVGRTTAAARRRGRTGQPPDVRARPLGYAG